MRVLVAVLVGLMITGSVNTEQAEASERTVGRGYQDLVHEIKGWIISTRSYSGKRGREISVHVRPPSRLAATVGRVEVDGLRCFAQAEPPGYEIDRHYTSSGRKWIRVVAYTGPTNKRSHELRPIVVQVFPSPERDRHTAHLIARIARASTNEEIAALLRPIIKSRDPRLASPLVGRLMHPCQPLTVRLILSILSFNLHAAHEYKTVLAWACGREARDSESSMVKHSAPDLAKTRRMARAALVEFLPLDARELWSRERSGEWCTSRSLRLFEKLIVAQQSALLGVR